MASRRGKERSVTLVRWDPDSEGRPMSDHRILFIADEVPADDGVRSVQHDLARATSIHMITPVLGTRIERATDADEPARRAAERCRETQSYLQHVVGEDGPTVTGEVVTDPPFEAAEQKLLDSQYDQIIVGLRSDEHWKEHDIVARLRRITDAPVVPITVDS